MNTFSIQRVGWLLRNLWATQQRHLVSYLCFHVAFVGLVLINLPANHIQQFVFLFGLFLNVALYFLALVHYMRNSSREYTLLPATTFEKFSAILLSQLIALTAFLALFILLNTTYNLLFANLLQIPQPTDPDIWRHSLLPSVYTLNPICWFGEQIKTLTGTSYLLFLFIPTIIIALQSGKKDNRLLQTFIIGILIIAFLIPVGSTKETVQTTSTSIDTEHLLIQDATPSVCRAAESPTTDSLLLAGCFCLTVLVAAYFALQEKEIY